MSDTFVDNEYVVETPFELTVTDNKFLSTLSFDNTNLEFLICESNT